MDREDRYALINERIEKLKFIAEEMQIAFFIAKNITDSFVARTIARHIVVRAENFIQHARGLLKPLRAAGYQVSEFHASKEAYASAFEEYFSAARHKLGAHVQDLDFGKRIELWNDIEIVKISFFVEGAQEIYRDLRRLSLPNYVAYTEPPELTNQVVLEALHRYQRDIENRNGIELGTDPLALTRPNTTALLNATPVHSRAGQLVLIRRWVAMQDDLLQKVITQPRIARLLKARIITDIVSFCDCLVTRPAVAGAPQEMDGLDKLIALSGESSAVIDDFVSTSNFMDELWTARSIRNNIGSHVDIDTTVTLANLLANLDSYDVYEALHFYKRVEAAFTKTCFQILFLKMYASDSQRVYGISSSHGQPVVPYADDGFEALPSSPPRYSFNDEEAYKINLMRWLHGNDDQKAEARYFFWKAFECSQAIETIEEIDIFENSGRRLRTHYLRKAHDFFSSTLSDELSDFEFRGALDIMVMCGNGFPYPLAEILVRHGWKTSPFRQWFICRSLGEISSTPHDSVRAFLQAAERSSHWPVRLQASIARFKTFVKDEGLYTLNQKGKTRVEFSRIIDALMKPRQKNERLIFLLAFASILSAPGWDLFSTPFKSNYEQLQNNIEDIIIPLLKQNSDSSKATTLKKLIQSNDYVGVSLLLAIDFEEPHPLRLELLESCCNGSISTAGHDQAARHLAMCFLLNKDHHAAFDIVQRLASRNPDWVDIQILGAEILGETVGSEKEATKWITGLRRSYKLNPELEIRLKEIEAEITKRV